MKDTKVIFMGTPDFSVPILNYLIKNTNVVLVVTKPDKKVGRKGEVVYSPIKKVAIENNIDVIQPAKIIEDAEVISECNPDLIITCAYGQIIPEEILNIPSIGSFNVHASILPKYRGASPIQSAILNGDRITGVTLMYMDKGMDTGDIVAIEKCDINNTDNFGTLHDKLSLLGVEVLKNTLEKVINKTNERIKQINEDATYTKLIKREDEKIDFNDLGESIINKIRALNPFPLANIIFDDKEIKIIDANFIKKNNTIIGKVNVDKKSVSIDCKDGIIELKTIKPQGKNIMKVESFVNGLKKDKEYYVK